MKKYYVNYYLRSNTGDKFIGSLQFSHRSTYDFPVERKAFMLADSRLIVADKLVITEIR